MGKKKGAGKKGKAGGGDDGGAPELTVGDQLEQAQATILALQRELEQRREETMRAVGAQKELQLRIAQYHRDFEAERENRFDITADMTRQYKAMQDELIRRNNELESNNAELRDQLELSRQAYEDLRQEKDAEIALKDAQIAELQQKMDDLSQEFADMLRDTLDKMSDQVERSKQTLEMESKFPGKERLESMHLGHVDI